MSTGEIVLAVAAVLWIAAMFVGHMLTKRADHPGLAFALPFLSGLSLIPLGLSALGLVGELPGGLLGSAQPPPRTIEYDKNEIQHPALGAHVEPRAPKTYRAEAFLLAADQHPTQVYGSFAIVLLGADEARSMALCQAFLRGFGGKDYRAIVNSDGMLIGIRPVYWPVKNKQKDRVEEPDCGQIIKNYDYNRADLLKIAFGLKGSGPFFVVAKAVDDADRPVKSLGAYDLSLVPTDELEMEFADFINVYGQDKVAQSVISATLPQKIKYYIIAVTPSVSSFIGESAAHAAAPK